MKFSIGDVFLYSNQGRIVIGKVVDTSTKQYIYDILYANQAFKDKNGYVDRNNFAYHSPIANLSQIMSEEEAKAAIV